MARPTRSGSGNGWRIAALVLLVLLLLSGMVNLVGFIGSLGGSGAVVGQVGPHLQEVLLERRASSHKIAVVDIDGIISSGAASPSGSSLVRLVEKELQLAAEDRQVRAVILRLDTPGGEVLASDDISQLIRSFQERSNKPVVACMGSVAASGGYYVAAPCRWIVAHELTITGSIGVILHGYNYRGLMDKVGLSPETYKSGKYKDMLSGSRSPEEITDEERRIVQGLIDETFERFKSVVRDGRQRAGELNRDEGRALTDGWQTYADGRVFSGKEAYRLGFVDELGDLKTAVKSAQRLARIPDASLVQYAEPFGLMNVLRLLGKTEPPSIKVDLGGSLPSLRPGLLYFIAPQFVR